MKKNSFILVLVGIPLSLIFLSFFNPAYSGLVRRSILIFTIFAAPYCLLVKDPRKGLLLFLLQASLLEGPWKTFTYGTSLKLLVYVIRDLLLYLSFFNFLRRKRQILPEDILRQRPPYAGFIIIFLLNVMIQIFNPAGYGYVNSIAGSRLFWETIPLYWMGFYLMRDKKNFEIFFQLCVICVFFNAIATIIQYSLGVERIASVTRGYYIMIHQWGRRLAAVFRVPGLGADMGFGGNYFAQAVTMLITLFLFPMARKEKLMTLFWLIPLSIVCLAGLIASAFRTAIISSVIAATIFLFLRRDIIAGKFFKFVVAILLLSLIIIPYMLDTFEAAANRYESIKNPYVIMQTVTRAERHRLSQAFITPFNYMLRFPWGNGLGKVGPGAGLFAKGKHAGTNAENTINLSITEIGAIGTILWLLFHIFIVRRGIHAYRYIDDAELKYYAAATLAYMLFALFAWQFGQLITFPQNAGFWFMAGTLMGLRYIKE